MKCDYQFFNNKKLVIAKITGVYQPSLSGSSIKRIANDIKVYDYNKILFDLREAEVKLETIPAYYRPVTFLKVGFSRSFKYAYLVNKISDNIHFLETVMNNNGFNFLVFTDYDSAIKWLVPENGNTLNLVG